MGEALVHLEQVLRSQDNLTSEEVNVLLTCKSKAIREFTSGALIGGSVALAATWKLSNFARAYLSVGAAAIAGMRGFNRSLNSCVDHILDLDGSRIQRELANIIVNKHQDDPWTMRRLNRHFYQERVFDDSSSDKPIIRWRYRNFFGENVGHAQSENDGDSMGDPHVSGNDSDSRKAPAESKQVRMNHDADVMEDPLDSIFGRMAAVEEIKHRSSSSTPAKANTRSHNRRAHRRRRLHHHESLGLKYAQPELT
ncbi:uncharacterized protein LOC126670195 isoform X2 [Mercurialis annua]|uniref:uncharacterized protein LOC126670195 isoform X2 n=1 Tax=Mercurialis annua TaxID=3986 RepID=UPI0021607EA3|nr:uncharacterized protein LOC126670195 isoform X2 [Mercurialis annua]